MTPLQLRRTVIAGGLLVSALYFGAVRAAQPEREFRETLYVFGTLVELVLYGEDAAEAQALTAEAGRALQQMHRDWHAWQPGALEELNAALASGETMKVAPRLAALLREGQSLACLSGGRFEPGIGALIELWGFHQDTPPEGAPPSEAEIAALRAAHPSILNLRFDGDRISATDRSVQLDLGGFAKGAALDEIGVRFVSQGYDNAVLNAGGDVNVIGAHGGRPWRVAIRDPFVWGAMGSVDLQPGEVLYTSGNYERYFEHDGQRFAHILDPRTGYPVSEIVSVSVLDTSGTRADAAATALAVAGRADWPQVAADMGVSAVLMIAGDGSLSATPEMLARLNPVGGAFPSAPQPVPLPVAAPDPACAAL
ncbi:FAD:protein FMN transferase [Alloyangia pacifica]|uniref:FAD:protein FMN transferase n=1 Tax=Alloyangia pacifica TaxID=311180 RepID=UPI001CFE5B7F|nr:FAD:protein FMN transferase [Alloyangia pacifica]